MGLLCRIFFESFLRADIGAVADVTVCVDIAQAFWCGAGQEDMLGHELKFGPAGWGIGRMPDKPC